MAMEQAQRCLSCDHGPAAKRAHLHNDIPAALFLLRREDFICAALKFVGRFYKDTVQFLHQITTQSPSLLDCSSHATRAQFRQRQQRRNPS
jgi:NADPH-dependent glutamate synthase beta subunit-like oxidoreductase